MATARQITDRALRLLRLYGAGETTSADDSAVALAALNVMVDAWSTSPLYILATTSEQFPLTPNVSSYSIGVGGDFNTTRPTRVLDSSFIRLNNVDYPLIGITEQQYNAITYKPSSGIPETFFYKPTLPLGELSFYFTPYFGMTLHLDSMKALTSFPDLNTDLLIGEGYRKALDYSLAEELAPEFDVEAPKSVVFHAANARRMVKRLNAVVPVLALGFGNRPYSTGDWRR